MQPFVRIAVLAFLIVVSSTAAAAGHLVVENAWIRSAPPGARMLAGYATLKNAGDAPVVVAGAQSDAFGSVTLHESMSMNGMEHMQALDDVVIAPGQSFALAPGGNHLMLMAPRHELHEGDAVAVRFVVKGGADVPATFVVRAEAAAP